VRPPRRPPSIHQRIGSLGRADIADTKSVTASLEGIAKLIDSFTYGRLTSTVALLTRQAKRAKGATGKQRLQNALALVQGEIGRRIGVEVDRAMDAIAGLEQVRTHSDRNLRRAGIDPGSVAGAQITESVARQSVQTINSGIGTLNAQLARARKSKNQKLIADIQGKLKESLEQLDEATAALADSVRATIEAQKQAIRDQAQEIGDAASFVTSIRQASGQNLELQQRLNKTFDSPQGRQARADFIRSQVIPQLQAEAAAIHQQGALYASIGDVPAWRQSVLAEMQKQNEIAQSQLEAQEAIEQTSEEAANALKEFSGSSVTEFKGNLFTDIRGIGVGA
jgi:gas vesicle protein